MTYDSVVHDDVSQGQNNQHEMTQSYHSHQVQKTVSYHSQQKGDIVSKNEYCSNGYGIIAQCVNDRTIATKEEYQSQQKDTIVSKRESSRVEHSIAINGIPETINGAILSQLGEVSKKILTAENM